MTVLAAKTPIGPRAWDTNRDPDSDAEMLALIDRGDARGALALLMQRYGAIVYRYCLSALDDAALADDVHQQVFIEAFCNLARFSRRSTVRTWLLGIARHRVLDAVKRRRRARRHLDDAMTVEIPDPRPSAVESLDDGRLRQALIVCIERLPAATRAAVLLRYQEGCTYEQMAEICAEKPGTLQARVARALCRLRDVLEDMSGEW